MYITTNIMHNQCFSYHFVYYSTDGYRHIYVIIYRDVKRNSFEYSVINYMLITETSIIIFLG